MHCAYKKKSSPELWNCARVKLFQLICNAGNYLTMWKIAQLRRVLLEDVISNQTDSCKFMLDGQRRLVRQKACFHTIPWHLLTNNLPTDAWFAFHHDHVVQPSSQLWVKHGPKNGIPEVKWESLPIIKLAFDKVWHRYNQWASRGKHSNDWSRTSHKESRLQMLSITNAGLYRTASSAQPSSAASLMTDLPS